MNWQAIAVFDIDGVIRDVSGSYRRALADTVEHFTQGAYRPTPADIDRLKGEGLWNNDWEASHELILRHFEAQGQARSQVSIVFDEIVDFFQRRYRGQNLDEPSQWTGYIAQEPILVTADYFDQLAAAAIGWGFFSGATRGSARYILEHRIGLQNPPLVAMEDAPGKPNPSGLFALITQLAAPTVPPVIYVGDTVADMHTIQRARQQQPEGHWWAVGVLPPHVAASGEGYAADYRDRLLAAGAAIVLTAVTDLTPEHILALTQTAAG